MSRAPRRNGGRSGAQAAVDVKLAASPPSRTSRYTAVLASWIFVAGAGLASLTGKWPMWLTIVCGIALGITYLFVVVLALSVFTRFIG